MRKVATIIKEKEEEIHEILKGLNGYFGCMYCRIKFKPIVSWKGKPVLCPQCGKPTGQVGYNEKTGEISIIGEMNFKEVNYGD